MSAPAHTVADYTAAMQALMPRGLAWPRDPDATQTLVLAALAAVYQRTNARANQLLVDAFPATAVELLPEWLSALGVPVPGTTLAPTVPGQQAQVVSALTSVGGASIAYFVALCLGVGVHVTVTQYTNFTVRKPCNLPINGDNWSHTWLVTVTGAPNPGLEALVTQYSPAHTVVVFKYV
jgi:uncharacterized protein YmfQ (DUF2313 family)